MSFITEKFKTCPRCGARSSSKHCKVKTCKWSICTKCVGNATMQLVFSDKNFFIHGGA